MRSGSDGSAVSFDGKRLLCCVRGAVGIAVRPPGCRLAVDAVLAACPPIDQASFFCMAVTSLVGCPPASAWLWRSASVAVPAFGSRICSLALALGVQIFEKSPAKVKNFGIWFRYESRTGTHNAYKEYRELSLTAAVAAMYQDMAGRSRAKSTAIQILKTSELKPDECKRTTVKQYHSSKIRFPLAHRVAKTPKHYKTTFKASRPTTFC